MSETEGQISAQIDAMPEDETVPSRQFYIGCKQVQAEPMTHAEFLAQLDRPVNIESESECGYLVVYPDGYESWSPRDVFESAYLPMGVDNDGTCVTEEMVKAFALSSGHKSRHCGKVFVGTVMLANGFAVTESAACVGPAKYDEDIGRAIVEDKVFRKVWELLGFLLQSARFGFRYTPPEFTEDYSVDD